MTVEHEPEHEQNGDQEQTEAPVSLPPPPFVVVGGMHDDEKEAEEREESPDEP